jgi:hypothetical protein
MTYPGTFAEVRKVDWKAQLPMYVTPLAKRIKQTGRGI